MLGPVKQRDERLFYCGFSLEDRMPQDHPLRMVRRVVDFSFVRREVAGLYGDRGNESIDPIVVLKLLFLKFFYQVSSTRELMRELPMRLDWLWFCEFDLSDEIPDHSVMSKARRRWGREVFISFFQRVLSSCVDAGLVDGGVVHIDASVIAADAGGDSIETQINLISAAVYDHEVREDGDDGEENHDIKNRNTDSHINDTPPAGTKVSRTDPDARLTRKNGRSILGYKDHRVIDDRCGIVTATITTPANVSEPHVLGEALQQHEAGTGLEVNTAVADKQYGTAANYRMLHESNVTPCIPHKRVREDPSKFARRLFVYDPAHDYYICPAGAHLTRRTLSDTNRHRYSAGKKVCDACRMRADCTENKTHGRTISRQLDQEMIDWADDCLSPARRKRLMSRRKTKGEGSFADATNRHGYKRMRWRGLLNAAVQNLIIAAIQNIRKLIKRIHHRPRPALASCAVVLPAIIMSNRALSKLISSMKLTLKKLISMPQHSPMWSTPTQITGQRPTPA